MFLEVEGAREFIKFFERYLRMEQHGKRAMLMCFCSWKLSEGIDFADDSAPAIFVVGFPYPCVIDPRVVHKQVYHDLQCREESNLELNSERWYKI
jgi:fanconi anemia group J protein